MFACKQESCSNPVQYMDAWNMTWYTCWKKQHDIFQTLESEFSIIMGAYWLFVNINYQIDTCLPFSLYLWHSFHSESEQPYSNRVKLVNIRSEKIRSPLCVWVGEAMLITWISQVCQSKHLLILTSRTSILNRVIHSFYSEHCQQIRRLQLFVLT